jgi:quercetin dioxygenase-like cupin family protein
VVETGDQLRTVDGTTFKLARSAHDTGGERVEFEITLPPGALSPPPHYHPKQTEEWHVLEGTLSIQLDGEWRELREGESATMPPGQVHTLKNRSNGVVRVRDVHIPAGGFQEYIESLYRLGQSGKVKSPRHPAGLIYLAMVLREERRRGGQVSASPVLRMAESVLASVGRLLRFRLP